MAPFVYATNEEMKINVTHGWFLWRLLKYSQIAFVHAFQANAVFIPELGNLGFNWLIWCMYFQQIIYVLGIHLQYKGQGLLECFSPVWRPDWKAEGNRWWNPFYRAGDVKRTAWSVTCLRVGCAGEQSLAYGSAHTVFKNAGSLLLVNALCSSFSLQTEQSLMFVVFLLR